MEPFLREETEKIGIEYAGMTPTDENISNFNLVGKLVLSLPPESPALLAMNEILVRMGLWG